MALRPNVFGIAFVVNDGGDAHDLFPGDGQCSTAFGTCTLRAALEETNARNTGEDGIVIEVPLVTLTQALPDISTPIQITGSSPDQTTVQRSQETDTPDFRIFSVRVTSRTAMNMASMTGR